MHETGLRERKRLATRRAIQIAVLELSLQHGFERVTVEDVGREAQVSPRTFFNYFTSKEDAVFGGLGAFAPTDDQRRCFIDGEGELVDDLISLLSVTSQGIDDLPLHRLRRRVLEQEPGLVGRHMAGAQAFEQQIADLITERLQGPRAATAGDPPADSARLLTLVALAVVRFGWGRWVAADGRMTMAESLHAARLAFHDIYGGTRPRQAQADLVGAR